jgi:hypothetical protein
VRVFKKNVFFNNEVPFISGYFFLLHSPLSLLFLLILFLLLLLLFVR